MGFTEINLGIRGMSSEHCAATIKNLIIDERSVKKVAVSLKNHSVTIHGSEGMRKEQIINAVNLSGTYSAH